MNDRPSRIIRVPTRCPEDWKHHLAHPDTQWKPGYSAWAVAHSWEEAQGFPPEVRQLFDRFGDPLKDLEPLVIVAEHSVRVPFGETDSQNDVFVLAKAGGGLVSITVEGKKEESFDKQVKDWLPVKSPGSDKTDRLQFLLGTLGLGAAAPATRVTVRRGCVRKSADSPINTYWLYEGSQRTRRPLPSTELDSKAQPWESLVDGMIEITPAMAQDMGLSADAVGKEIKTQNVAAARMLKERQTEIEEIHEHVQEHAWSELQEQFIL
jgi:hypothetical protein